MTDPSNEPLPPDDFAKTYRHRVFRGMAIMWGINLLHLASAFVFSRHVFFGSSSGPDSGLGQIGIWLIFGYPLIALFYGAMLLAAYREREGIFKGLLIATFVTALLSCTCWAYALTHIGG